jgi:hypothetical protein
MNPNPATDDIPDGFRKERWVFLGEHTGTKTKRVASFRDENGATWSIPWKPQHNRLAPGYLYEILTNTDTIRGTFTWTSEKAADYEDIRMHSRARARTREIDRLEDKARTSDPQLQELLDHVSDCASRLVRDSSKEALVRLLDKTVWQSARKPR